MNNARFLIGVAIAMLAVPAMGATSVLAEQSKVEVALPYEEFVPTTEEIFGWIERICAQGIRRAGHPAEGMRARAADLQRQRAGDTSVNENYRRFVHSYDKDGEAS